MRGAFGKPIGTVARVHIRQVMMSIRTRANHENSAIEAFRRAKFKFPGLFTCLFTCLPLATYTFSHLYRVMIFSKV